MITRRVQQTQFPKITELNSLSIITEIVVVVRIQACWASGSILRLAL